MKRLILISAFMALVLPSCQHKDLCFHHRDHAHKYHMNIVADYRYDWEEDYGHRNWEETWPEGYIPYDELRPGKPTGIRVINSGADGQSNIHNIGPDGGVVTLYEGNNDILFYNNDTEYIIFSRSDHGVTTRATTRTRTRATYTGSKYAAEGEETMTPPDMLYANYFEGVYAEKVLDPVDLNVTLQPLVFTYKIRYEFAAGLEYVAIARGALSGMAKSVLLNTGETSEESATLLYDCELTDYGVGARVMSFGVPAFPNVNYPTRAPINNSLNLELVLKNGKLMTLDFDVTDQVQLQPHGGVIVVSGIEIKAEDGSQGSGAFDVEVNDWGEYEDIYLPLM